MDSQMVLVPIVHPVKAAGVSIAIVVGAPAVVVPADAQVAVVAGVVVRAVRVSSSL